jgi:hypothetical protein
MRKYIIVRYQFSVSFTDVRNQYASYHSDFDSSASGLNLSLAISAVHT